MPRKKSLCKKFNDILAKKIFTLKLYAKHCRNGKVLKERISKSPNVKLPNFLNHEFQNSDSQLPELYSSEF